jgi:hypothetical protein
MGLGSGIIGSAKVTSTSSGLGYAMHAICLRSDEVVLICSGLSDLFWGSLWGSKKEVGNVVCQVPPSSTTAPPRFPGELLILVRTSCVANMCF